eukprot:702523-Alexandrium_andersonii.AAC.1
MEDAEALPSFASFAAAYSGMAGGAQVSAMDLSLTFPELGAFAREYRVEGEKVVAVEMVYELND